MHTREHSREVDSVVPGEWEVVDQFTQLSDRQRKDVQEIYEQATIEMRQLAMDNMSLKDVGLLKLVELFNGREKSDTSPDDLSSVRKGDMPIFLFSRDRERVLGVAIVRQQFVKNWTPKNMRDSLLGPPLSRSYEIEGIFLKQQARGILHVLPRFIYILKRQIERDASGMSLKEGDELYVYFDRPNKAPLPDEAISKFHLRKKSPSDASAEKKGFSRYSLHLKLENGRCVPVASARE